MNAFLSCFILICLFYSSFILGLISDVLKDNKVYHETLMSWLEPIVLPAAQWFRCFKASDDGWDASILHQNCDHKGPTVTLVKVREYIFGGFLDQNWEGTCNYFVMADIEILN